MGRVWGKKLTLSLKTGEDLDRYPNMEEGVGRQEAKIILWTWRVQGTGGGA